MKFNYGRQPGSSITNHCSLLCFAQTKHYKVECTDLVIGRNSRVRFLSSNVEKSRTNECDSLSYRVLPSFIPVLVGFQHPATGGDHQIQKKKLEPESETKQKRPTDVTAATKWRQLDRHDMYITLGCGGLLNGRWRSATDRKRYGRRRSSDGPHFVGRHSSGLATGTTQ